MLFNFIYIYIWQVGSDSTNPMRSSNGKSSGDLVSSESKCEIDEKNVTLSLVQLQETKSNEQKVSDKYCEAQPAEEHEAVPVWLHPQMMKSSNRNAAVVPDLELTLAVSKGKAKTMEQTKSSSDSFFLGPIIVT